MLTLDPIWQPETQQAQFRLLLEAMSYPGRCYSLLNISEENSAALAVLAVLMDSEVSLADPHFRLEEGDWPLLQVNSKELDEADYILCDGSKTLDFLPKLGSLACPEQSATLILVVEQLGQGDINLKLTGPGINGVNELRMNGLAPHWLTMRSDSNGTFPLGVDWILVDKTQMVALPRTTQVEVM